MTTAGASGHLRKSGNGIEAHEKQSANRLRLRRGPLCRHSDPPPTKYEHGVHRKTEFFNKLLRSYSGCLSLFAPCFKYDSVFRDST